MGCLALRCWNLVICLHQDAPLLSWSARFDSKALHAEAGGAHNRAMSMKISNMSRVIDLLIAQSSPEKENRKIPDACLSRHNQARCRGRIE
jgi:hypothetical protein